MFEQERDILKNIFLLLFVVVLFLGCTEEIDILIISDVDEIERYVYDSDLGHDFFRNTNVILETPYEYTLDTGAIYSDHVDSTDRFVLAKLSSTDQKIGTVVVADYFYVTTTRVKNSDTALLKRKRELIRYGYFEKLGDDGQRFSGWQIRGFSGLINNSTGGVTLYREDNTVFRNIYSSSSDPRYTFLTSSTSLIGRINNGETLRAKMNVSGDSYNQILSVETNTGHIYEQFSESDSSVQFRTPTFHPQSWNLIFFEDFIFYSFDSLITTPPYDSIGFSLSTSLWCEPYRVD